MTAETIQQGSIIGHLTVIARERGPTSDVYWLCRCRCGQLKARTEEILRSKRWGQCQKCGLTYRKYEQRQASKFEG